MYPTYDNGDKGIAFKGTIKNIERFDIVIIEKEVGYRIIKRVVGLPNETIEYKDNKLYVNGEYITEDFLVDSWTSDFKVVLGDDEYFCLGDNRRNSMDSRSFGAFSKKQIVASDFTVLEKSK